MVKSRTLADVLLNPGKTRAGIRYLQGNGREARISYADLAHRARGLLGRFQQQGLGPGDPVLLFLRNNMAFIDAFWACQLGGLVPVPLTAGVHAEYLHKLASVADKFETPFLYTERDLLNRFYKVADDRTLFMQRVCLLEDIEALNGEGVPHLAEAGDTALIQFSSGSTSEPKGVVLSHANLLSNIMAISTAAAITADDSSLSWMPLSHDMGLIGFHLVPLFNGLEQILMDTGLFVRRPARWLEMAHQYRSTLLCSPNFGYQHYLKSVSTPADNLDLSGVRLIFNGAEPVSASVCRDFATHLQATGLNADAFYPVYGLAEASLAVSFPRPGSGVQSVKVSAHHLSIGDTVLPDASAGRLVELVCLGYPVDGCELRICDDKGSALPDYRLGHVQIRGDNVTSGYYPCRECEESVPVDGWLDTGDVGLMSEQGLFITGRCKDILFVSGQNWYPQDIEQLLQQETGIEAGKVAVSATRDEANAEDLLLVFIQYRRAPVHFIELFHRTRTLLTESTGLHAHAIVPVHTLPRTTSGKLQRFRLVQAFEAGDYTEVLAELQSFLDDEASATSENEIEQQLLDICKQAFPDKHISPDQNLFDLGADSLILVRIHSDIEARFPGRVEVTDLFDYPTISSLAEHLQA